MIPDQPDNRKQEARLILCYLSRRGIAIRTTGGTLEINPLGDLLHNDLPSIQDVKAELIELLESDERVVDDFAWGPKFSTPEREARRLQ